MIRYEHSLRFADLNVSSCAECFKPRQCSFKPLLVRLRRLPRRIPQWTEAVVPIEVDVVTLETCYHADRFPAARTARRFDSFVACAELFLHAPVDTGATEVTQLADPPHRFAAMFGDDQVAVEFDHDEPARDGMRDGPSSKSEEQGVLDVREATTAFNGGRQELPAGGRQGAHE